MFTFWGQVLDWPFHLAFQKSSGLHEEAMDVSILEWNLYVADERMQTRKALSLTLK